MESNEATFKIKNITKPLSGVSWYKLWMYLRESPTLTILRDRLDEINIMYPSAVTYTDFLWRTSSTWALCSIGWSLNLGLQATSYQEGLHSTMKSMLSGKFVQLHRVVNFFREVTANRSYNFSRRHHDSPLPKLISKLEEYGCSNLVIAITTSLTLHGQTRLAESCEKGLNYTVHLLNNENEINECYKLTGHRHSSQARFQLIIKKQYPNFKTNIESSCSSNSATSPCLPMDDTSPSLSGVNITSLIDDAPIIFYKVESRKKEGLVDIVAIYPNGSICSTGSNFANYGLPCELEMAVFLAGKIHINMCFNFHPICQEPHLKDLGVKML